MKMAIDTHKAIKKLQAVNFTEEQAETIVEVTQDGVSAIDERFNRFEETLNTKLKDLNDTISRAMTWMGLGLGFIAIIVTLHALIAALGGKV